MSPTCCENSKEHQTVRFFEPAAQSTPATWVVPLRDENGKASTIGCTQARFCPFCGTKLTQAHIPFDPAAPSGSAER